MWKKRIALCVLIVGLQTEASVGWISTSLHRRRGATGHVSVAPHQALADVNHQSNHDGNNCMRQSRRESLAAILSVASAAAFTQLVAWGTHPTRADASEVRAPIELLRPATRVKLYIDEAVNLASNNNNNNTASPTDTLQALSQFFAQEPTTFLTIDEQRLSRRFLEIDTSSAWQRARLKDREARGAELGIDYTTPYDQLNTALQQWGDKRTFQILRSRQSSLERSNTIRAALNAYTNNLVFGDAYQLNVQPDVKKAMVRNDALPNVNAVVVSDLDLRDLTRNQILQNMDDARAELNYQVQSGDVNIAEIATYLRQAQAACQEWFAFIPSTDVQQALEQVNGVYRVVE